MSAKAVAVAARPAAVDEVKTKTREHADVLRGSSLLLVGRVLAMALALLTQILLVRYLSKPDFGTLAYALALAAVIQSVLPLGLDRADTRFLALYDERRDHARMLGVIATEAGIIAIIGLVTLTGMFLLRGVVLGSIPGSRNTVAVVLVLALTAPLVAFDNMVLNVFAVFARPKEVFVRRYLLDPGLRLLVVLVLLVNHMSVVTLAIGYVLSGVAGSLLYTFLLVRLLRKVLHGSKTRFHIVWPGRELVGFALPLLAGSVAYSATTWFPAVILGHLGTVRDVAELRAVQPLAQLIIVAPTVFATLFTPQAARYAAREDHAGLRRHYWSTATWVAVLAFPAAVMMIDFSGPLTRTLYTSRYAAAAPMLVVLGIAFYLNAALGLNGSVLQVMGRLRILTITNSIGLVIAFAMSIVLVPRLHGFGAALAVGLAVAVPQLLKQRGLAATPVKAFDAASLRLWPTAIVLLAALGALSSLGSWNLAEAIAATIVAEVVLFLRMRHWLDFDEVFPGAGRVIDRLLSRVPGLHRLQTAAIARAAARPAVRPVAGATTRASTPDARTKAPAKPAPTVPNAIEPWHQVDWRFLLADPTLQRVWLSPGCRGDADALRAIGIEVPDDVASGVDAACTVGTELDFELLTQALPPATVVRILVAGPPSGSGPFARVRPWDAWRREVQSRGWSLEAVQWAVPNRHQPRAFAPVADRHAVRFLLMISPAGRKGRVKARIASALTRLGLVQVVCREGIILARTPS